MNNPFQLSNTEKDTILLVDDEPANLSVLSYILKDNYRILAVKSGRLALKVLSENKKIDLIILDINMPEMNGFQTIEEIRKNPSLIDIPVIFITTIESDINEVFGLKTGAVDYIHKPIKPEIVKLRIKNHLELKKNRDLLHGQNEWLENEIKKQVDEKIFLLEISLTTIIGLAETRDTDTGNHIIRTKEYVNILGTKLYAQNSDLFYSLEDIEIMSKAAQLHDIGKIGIADSILLKPGPLTKEEFEIMKTHSTIGGEAIEKAMKRAALTSKNNQIHNDSESFKLLDYARTIALSHHEKWDGTGYPHGLKASVIPLPARLMAIADVFDALTSKRVYKESMPFNKAIDIICEGSGSHFDPILVEILKESKNQFQQILVQYIET